MSQNRFFSKTQCPFHSAAEYQIKVLGWLGQDWSEWFDGLTITNQAEVDSEPVTVLTGCVIDQAALHGILRKIANLGLPLLAVNRLHSKTTHATNENPKA